MIFRMFDHLLKQLCTVKQALQKMKTQVGPSCPMLPYNKITLVL